MNALLADCGGTFSRFALLENGIITPLVTLRNADFLSFKAVVEHALKRCASPPSLAAFAISGTDDRAQIKFTNNSFTASRQELLALGFTQVHVMNDFVPLSLALSDLAHLNIAYLDTRPAQKGHRLVVGVGTGLGVGALLQVGEKWHALASEGGHSYFQGVSDLEKAVVAAINVPIIYLETLLSGDGFLRIYQALRAINGLKTAPEQTSETLVAQLSQDKLAQEAARLFWDSLARACDNFALTFLTHGGVYLTGGMCERLRDYLDPVRFRDIFTQKPHYHSLLDKMPLGVIMSQDPAFLGLKAFVLQQGKFI